jgi:hypothetical protein
VNLLLSLKEDGMSINNRPVLKQMKLPLYSKKGITREIPVELLDTSEGMDTPEELLKRSFLLIESSLERDMKFWRDRLKKLGKPFIVVRRSYAKGRNQDTPPSEINQQAVMYSLFCKGWDEVKDYEGVVERPDARRYSL